MKQIHVLSPEDFDKLIIIVKQEWINNVVSWVNENIKNLDGSLIEVSCGVSCEPFVAYRFSLIDGKVQFGFVYGDNIETIVDVYKELTWTKVEKYFVWGEPTLNLGIVDPGRRSGCKCEIPQFKKVNVSFTGIKMVDVCQICGEEK